MFSSADQQYMQRANQLARRGQYTTAPNPNVGCVLVKDGQIIGEGWHVRAGEGHAEVNAIASVNDPAAVVGCTAYVTLEPCNHTGRTGPCTEALVSAGVARVVVAMDDPNPLVAGSGTARLRQAGITVDSGLFGDEAAALNPGYIKRMRTGLPRVRLKMAASLDGRTAMANGESQWITGAAARGDVQCLRAASGAIVTGIGTVLSDDPSLTVRADQLPLENAASVAARQPLRVVLDSQLRLPSSAKLLQQPGQTAVVCGDVSLLDRVTNTFPAATLLACPDGHGGIDLLKLLRWLGEQQINEVLVEAGATLAGAFWQQGLVDLLTVYIAPVLLGSAARPLLELPFDRMAEAQRLQVVDWRPVGDDWRIDAIPASAQRDA